jgi:hypothetical protein
LYTVTYAVARSLTVEIMRTYGQRSERFAKVTRGYAGWLMTNRQFLAEHDELLAAWAQMIRKWGLDRLGILLPHGISLPGNDPTADPQWPGYGAAFEAFFLRWRLQGLAAPRLPVPLQPLMAGVFPASILPQVMRAAGVFCIPDTYPIPSRDELRGMLEDSLHGSGRPEHLVEWMTIIAGHNAAKKPIPRYARLFEVQHYWRVLHQRHPEALRRKGEVVKRAIASFLGTSEGAIHSDLLVIRNKLGADWPPPL